MTDSDSDFDPLNEFCEMHHDKLIDGNNPFGPAGIGLKCKAFVWSKVNLPYLEIAIEPNLHDIFSTPATLIDMPVIERVRLPKVSGQTSGDYFLYVLEDTP